MLGEKPKKTRTLLVAGDNPENDLSDFCDQDQTKEYQTIVGQLIWFSGLGRFDIAAHAMKMSRFRQQPRVGHHVRLKRIIGYLANFPHGSLRFRTHEPDYSNLPHKEYDSQRTVYSGAKEEIPHDIPEPKGTNVTTTTYVDANLHHDQVTGRAVTAFCKFLPIGIPKGKLQLKLQLLALNLWQPELLQTKSLTSGTPSCSLEFESDAKATCLVITNL